MDKNLSADVVEVVLTHLQGSVQLGGYDTTTELNNTYEMWNGIKATENFPITESAGGYILTLRKPANSYGDVDAVEADLQSALRLLSYAWPFSGGSSMKLDERTEVISSAYTSTAKEAKNIFSKRANLQVFSADHNMPISWDCRFSGPPLKTAIEISHHTLGNKQLELLLKSYQSAQLEPSSWAIHLSLARDCIKHFYENKLGKVKQKRVKISDIAKTELGITNDWSLFGNLINNCELRHPLRNDKEPTGSDEEKTKCYEIIRKWISTLLSKEYLINIDNKQSVINP